MIFSQLDLSTEEKCREIILQGEKRFAEELERIADKLIAVPGLKFLTLSGPTCSGKTTTAAKLLSDITRSGARVRVISIDDFFRPRRELLREAEKEGKTLDMDSVSAIDLNALKKCVSDITANGTVHCPVFDFNIGESSGTYTFPAADYDIFLFEGIQAIYPEVSGLLNSHPLRSIFISVNEDVTVGDNIFTGRDIRFMRRLVRDYRFRSSPPEATFEHWDGVVANETSSIIPNSHKADIKINSYLGYDLCVLKTPVTELLLKIDKENPHYKDALKLIEKLAPIPEISPEPIPENSIYREFLG